MTQQTLSFKDAFAILKTNAQKLESQSEPDIDNLLATIEQSVAAYKVCKDRIDAAEKAMNLTFSHDQ